MVANLSITAISFSVVVPSIRQAAVSYTHLFRESDAEAFFKCCQNPNIGNNAGWKPHGSLEESQEILRSVFISQSGIWAIILKEDGRLIGSVGIIPDPKRENPQARMLGYWLDESHWGKGRCV